MDYTILIAITFVFMLLLSLPSSVLFVQNASALASVVQITSAKADGSNLINGAFATIAQGKTTVKVTFDYRGFDDNDHVLELRCSWDGINYQKSNCSYESAESRTTFTGPDGVARAYYVKTGTASRDLTAPPVPKTYTFGVKVLNENGNLSPAATWSFKMRSSTTPPVGGAEEGTGGTSPQNLNKIKVTFNSITVNDDHSPDLTYTPGFRGTPGFPTTTPRAGEWQLKAYVKDQLVRLFDDKEVLTGKTYQLQGKEATVDLKSDFPLSIFTTGFKRESTWMGFCGSGPHTPQQLNDFIFKYPVSLWKQKIHEAQLGADCSGMHTPLGFVNVFNLPPDYLKTDPGESSGFFDKYIPSAPNVFKIKSSTKDFTLRYTISVEP
jgi:hypothetical protein